MPGLSIFVLLASLLSRPTAPVQCSQKIRDSQGMEMLATSMTTCQEPSVFLLITFLLAPMPPPLQLQPFSPSLVVLKIIF